MWQLWRSVISYPYEPGDLPVCDRSHRDCLFIHRDLWRHPADRKNGGTRCPVHDDRICRPDAHHHRNEYPDRSSSVICRARQSTVTAVPFIYSFWISVRKSGLRRSLTRQALVSIRHLAQPVHLRLPGLFSINGQKDLGSAQRPRLSSATVTMRALCWDVA